MPNTPLWLQIATPAIAVLALAVAGFSLYIARQTYRRGGARVSATCEIVIGPDEEENVTPRAVTVINSGLAEITIEDVLYYGWQIEPAQVDVTEDVSFPLRLAGNSTLKFHVVDVVEPRHKATYPTRRAKSGKITLSWPPRIKQFVLLLGNGQSIPVDQSLKPRIRARNLHKASELAD